MKQLRVLALFLSGAAVAFITTAAFAQINPVTSVPGCSGVWSNGACWLNFINVPPDPAPSPIPPEAGQPVFIVPLSSITLDVDAQQSSLDVNGSMIQPSNNLAISGVLTVASSVNFSGTYQLSGGTLTVAGGSDTIGVGIAGSTFNQSGGTLNVTQAIALSRVVEPGTSFDATGVFNLSDGNLNAGGFIIGNGQIVTGISGITPVFGPNNGIFNQSGGAASFSGPVVIGGPLDAGGGIGGGMGSVTISGGTFDVASSVGFGMVVGGTGTGTVTQSDGTVTITSGPTDGGLELGRSAGGSGTYVMSGGDLNVNRESAAGPGAFVLVGNAGTGTFTQSGGSVSVEGTTTLGFAAGGSGNYTLSGSATTLETEHMVIRTGVFSQSGGLVKIDTNSAGPAGGSLSIFNGGAYDLTAGAINDARLEVEFTEIIQGGIFTQSGGTNIMDGPLTIGNGGQYFLGGIGSQLTVGDDATVTNGSITQTGGSAQINGAMTLDGSGAGIGAYSLGGLGNLAVAAGIVIGDSGIGTFTQTAGTASLAGGTLTLGKSATGNGTYSLSSTGALAAGGDVVVGDAGTGAFNQTGGNISVAGTLTLGSQAGSQGTWNFSDGELRVTTAVVVGDAGSGVFIQSGGLHTIDGDLTIAATAGSKGTYTLSDGTLQVGGNELIGLVPGDAPSLTNAFVQTGGVHQVSGTLIVGDGGGGMYSLAGGTLLATNETIGAVRVIPGLSIVAGTGVFNQSGGINTVANTLTIGSDLGTVGTYNLSGGIINAGTPKTQGLVNNSALNVTGTSFINANVLNNATGVITVTNATLNVSGVITNLGTIALDPSRLTVQGLNIGATGVMTAGAGDVVDVLGDFLNNSIQNTLWNTDAAELDFTSGILHRFALAGQNGAGFANDFSWGTLDLGVGDSLELLSGSGDALYVNALEGLLISGDQITNITGASGLFLYYNAADNPLLNGNYFLEGGGELIALGGGSTATVPEPSSLGLLLVGLATVAWVGRRRTQRSSAD